jgi:hypothetical protein
MGRRPIAGIAYIQTGGGLLLKPFLQSGQILCRFRLALQRKSGPQIGAFPAASGTPAVLPSRYMASVDHTGLLRRSPRCSVITHRARMQQRPSSATASVSSAVPPRALWLECGPVEKKKRPAAPSWQRAMWLSACRRREKRPSAI